VALSVKNGFLFFFIGPLFIFTQWRSVESVLVGQYIDKLNFKFYGLSSVFGRFSMRFKEFCYPVICPGEKVI